MCQELYIGNLQNCIEWGKRRKANINLIKNGRSLQMLRHCSIALNITLILLQCYTIYRKKFMEKFDIFLEPILP